MSEEGGVGGVDVEALASEFSMANVDIEYISTTTRPMNTAA